MAQGASGNTGVRAGSWNQEIVSINRDFASNHAAALETSGVILPALQPENGFWGANYGNPDGVSGSSAIPMVDIPTGPIFSLAQFAHANLSVRADEPMCAAGNSLASPFIDPVSPYGPLPERFNEGGDTGSSSSITVSDTSWLINDALFDRYYLSGLAPEFTLTGSYSPTGTLKETLEKFFEVKGADYRQAQANPVLQPYLPEGESAPDAVDALVAEDGYRKMGAYSLIAGSFNVNSTSVRAWTALLRANRGLAVTYAQGGNDSGSAGTSPYPRGTSPASSKQAEQYWSGLSRLSNAQIDDLAEEIVKQVKLRGPFMSLADFVNHRVGKPRKDATHYMGALQAAIEDSGINSQVHAGAGGSTVNYATSNLRGSFSNPMPGNRPTTTGIVTDITQADLLQPLAPRLSARSDTFRIRAYGEVRSADGTSIVAQAMCEAVVQRIPEYLDTANDPDNNEPWDEVADPSGASTLNPLNQKFGRRFKLIQFRWLAQNEI
ncbi:MAG: hypothetical protein H7A51_18285 [Akkermansiaceae bacterium]|nr:hypothetical protein [Akkermansiaceae bacterium]